MNCASGAGNEPPISVIASTAGFVNQFVGIEIEGEDFERRSGRWQTQTAFFKSPLAPGPVESVSNL
jgi:hypothetical protein